MCMSHGFCVYLSLSGVRYTPYIVMCHHSSQAVVRTALCHLQAPEGTCLHDLGLRQHFLANAATLPVMPCRASLPSRQPGFRENCAEGEEKKRKKFIKKQQLENYLWWGWPMTQVPIFLEGKLEGLRHLWLPWPESRITCKFYPNNNPMIHWLRHSARDDEPTQMNLFTYVVLPFYHVTYSEIA